MVKLVDTADLKSAAYPRGGVPVRFRSRAPFLFHIPINPECLVSHCLCGHRPGRCTSHAIQSQARFLASGMPSQLPDVLSRRHPPSCGSRLCLRRGRCIALHPLRMLAACSDFFYSRGSDGVVQTDSDQPCRVLETNLSLDCSYLSLWSMVTADFVSVCDTGQHRGRSGASPYSLKIFTPYANPHHFGWPDRSSQSSR